VQLATVGVGQRAERLVVSQASETERSLGHRGILAKPLPFAAIDVSTPSAPQTHRLGRDAVGVSSSSTTPNGDQEDT
jgi:hypothetical protein